MINSIEDFKKLYPDFKELSLDKKRDFNLGLADNKLGGTFYIKQTNTCLLMKITISPNLQASI